MIVELRSVPDCPNLAPVRRLLYAALANLGLPPGATELVGDYPSPSVLINGADVTGRSAGSVAACRLDLPTDEQIRAALRNALASEAGDPLINSPASADRAATWGLYAQQPGEDRLVDRFQHASSEEPGDEPVRVEAEEIR